MREGKAERSPFGLCDGDEEIVSGEHTPAFLLMAAFRADARKATRGQMRNEDRTREMLQHCLKKDIHRTHHNHSPSQLARLL